MKALIKVGYGCNENCTFCHTQDVRHIDAPASEVEAKIRRAKALGHSMVVLSGGEPTIRAEVPRWAQMVADLDMDFGLVSNGLMLAYPEMVQTLLASRLRYVYMSLHGGEPQIHNRLVRRGTFDAAIAALENLSGLGLDITANCVVTKSNLSHLDGLVRRVSALPDVVLKFSMVEPKGGAWQLFDQVVPNLEAAASAVREALALGDRTTGQPQRFVHGGFPLCLMPGYEDRYDDLKTHDFATMIEVGEPDFFPVDDRNKITPEERCAGCALRGPCPGVFKAYRDRFGDAMLHAQRDGLRSNAFDYVFEAVVATDQPKNLCVLRDGGVTPWDRGRHLFVRHQGRVGRYRADSRDFSDDMMEVVKHEFGQVYLDASRKDSPDDFSRDLVKLERSSLCEGCPEFAACTGLFEPRFEDVFAADDQGVREILAGLRGELLDVGCGGAPYLDALLPAVQSGELRYVGVDPDPRAVQRLRAQHPGLDLRVGGVETVAADQRFDHVTVLRSWNHFRDPAAAARTLAGVVRPGGTLLVVDNVAFGLARTPRQTARARKSASAVFEHYRNDSAAQAHRYFADTGLRLTDRADIRPDRSNQWFLRYDAAAR